MSNFLSRHGVYLTELWSLIFRSAVFLVDLTDKHIKKKKENISQPNPVAVVDWTG